MIEPIFKEGLNPKEFEVLHPKLKAVHELLAGMLTLMGYKAMITSMLRHGEIAGESGVHATGRGMDIVPKITKDSIYRYVQERDMQALAAAVNTIYKRNDQLHTCMWHNSGTGWHFHLQVPWTKSYKDLAGKIPVAVSTV